MNWKDWKDWKEVYYQTVGRKIIVSKGEKGRREGLNHSGKANKLASKQFFKNHTQKSNSLEQKT